MTSLSIAAEDDGSDRLSRLVIAAEGGADVSITRNGTLVARLVAVGAASPAGRARAADALRTLRLRAHLDDLDWSHLRDEGRR